MLSDLSNRVFQFVNSFFKAFVFLVAVLAGLYIYQNYENELNKLPVIQELTDTYKSGLAAIGGLSREAVNRFYSVKDTDDRIIDYEENVPVISEGPSGGRLVVNCTWNKDRIWAQLNQRRLSRAKLRQAQKYLAYIDVHKADALQDMRSSKVLASIKLAQALLESDAGESRLARATNNQFGIKALPGSAARLKIRNKQYQALRDEEFTPVPPAVSVYNAYDDNPYDRFEVYNSVADSYARHSQLLTRGCATGNKGCYEWIWRTFPVGKQCDLTEAALDYLPASKIRPENFFDGRTSVPYYAACAAGLKMAGYATGKVYHKKLAYIIETYELWRLDIDLLAAMQASGRVE